MMDDIMRHEIEEYSERSVIIHKRKKGESTVFALWCEDKDVTALEARIAELEADIHLIRLREKEER